jgi:hypothetical protein
VARTDRLIKRASEHLEDGEVLLAWVMGVYESELFGTDVPRNGLLLATDRRLLFYGLKLHGYDFESFPYENVSSFEQGRNFYGGYAHFFASGNRVEVKWVQKRRDLDALVKEVKARMGRRGSAPAEISARPDVPERLRALAGLHADGVLTDEEFNRKKAELLREL